jgi:hypothetical protein
MRSETSVSDAAFRAKLKSIRHQWIERLTGIKNAYCYIKRYEESALWALPEIFEIMAEAPDEVATLVRSIIAEILTELPILSEEERAKYSSYCPWLKPNKE